MFEEGNIVGNLRILSTYTKKQSGKSRKYAIAECLLCRDVVHIRADSIKNGTSQNCAKCNRGLHKPIQGYVDIDPTPAVPPRRGMRIGGISNDIFQKIKVRGIKTTLTKLEIAALIVQECYICGHIPDLSVPSRKNPYNGIDRVDNEKGYLKGNTKPCCRKCNFAKHTMTLDEFFSHVRKIAAQNNLLI